MGQIPAGPRAARPRSSSKAAAASNQVKSNRRLLLKKSVQKNSPKVEKTLNQSTKNDGIGIFCCSRKQSKSSFGEHDGQPGGEEKRHIMCSDRPLLHPTLFSSQVSVGRVQQQDYHRARRSSSYINIELTFFFRWSSCVESVSRATCVDQSIVLPTENNLK